jgi:transposase
MHTSRHTIYDIFKRWATEGHAGLDDTPPIPHEPARKVSFQDIQEVRRLARNPDLGAYRVMAALEQSGIKLSQRTCGRLLELNRNLPWSRRDDPRWSPRRCVVAFQTDSRPA